MSLLSVFVFHLPAVTTGLRVGELLAMKWGNLDWNIEKYYVKETMLRARGGHASGFAPPKTDTSAAPINLTPSCIKALQQHRRRQSEDRLKARPQRSREAKAQSIGEL